MANKKALVLGSIAFDYIMSVPENYYDALSINHETQEVQGTFISVKKIVSFGGTGGNIAYNMALLGGKPILPAYVGEDFKALGYQDHLAAAGVDARVETITDDSTASCYIFNDLKKNQITIFHGGALNETEKLDLPSIISSDDEVAIAINAPNNMPAMAKFAAQLREMDIPCIFDPGQMLNILTEEQCMACYENATAFISNEHEYEGIKKKHGIDVYEGNRFVWVITTKGSRGSEIHKGDEVIEIPCVPAGEVVDPTGAGDAYRGGLLAGLTAGLDIVSAAKIGAVMGSINVEHVGGQSYNIDMADVASRYENIFGESYPL
jgi:adenosine kinase